MSNNQISAADWKSSQLTAWPLPWTSDTYNRFFSLLPITAVPCSTFKPKLLGRIQAVAFKSKFKADGFQGPALCLKLPSQSSDPSAVCHYVVQPENFVVLKPFDGYTPISPAAIAKEKQSKAKKDGQWFKFIFNQFVNHPTMAPSGGTAEQFVQPPTPLKVSSYDAITPLAKNTDNQPPKEGWSETDDDNEGNEGNKSPKMPFTLGQKDPDEETQAYKSNEDDIDVGGPKKSPPVLKTPPSGRPTTGDKVPRVLEQKDPALVTLLAQAKHVLKQRYMASKSKSKKKKWYQRKEKRQQQGKEMSEDECSTASDCSGDSEFAIGVGKNAKMVVHEYESKLKTPPPAKRSDSVTSLTTLQDQGN